MIKLKQAVIVEGKYDKIKLSSILDAVIITTDGFGIFKNKEKTELIRTLAESCGIIILTDSDTAGFKIRNHLKGCIKNGRVINVYAPQICGKEKRKDKPSAEGFLGVEGISPEILEKALSDAGITADKTDAVNTFLDKSRMMDDGLIGKENSANIRRELLKALGLPPLLSTSSMLEIINTLYSEQDYSDGLDKVRKAMSTV